MLCLVLSVARADAAVAEATQAGSAAVIQVDRPHDELLLLAVRIDDRIIADSFPAYPVAGGLIIPFGELTRLLDFSIAVHPAEGRAHGFFIDEKRLLNLDVPAQRVIVERQHRPFRASQVEVHADDIYVDTRLISTWLPVDFTVDLYGSLLTIHPREPLPLQLRRGRQLQAERHLAGRDLGEPRYSLVPNPYRLWDGPFVDHTQRLLLTPGGAGNYSASTQFSSHLTADLLYAETSLHVAGDTQRVSDARLSMARNDPAARLLGPLRARQLGVGEVLYPGVDNIALAFSGPGVLLSNFPIDRQTQFHRHTFRGELPDGWEIELYQNDALIAVRRAQSNGLYEFADVPLLFGLNVFRTVEYGAQGQRRERVYRFNVGESLTPPGTVHYRLVGNEPRAATRRTLFEVDLGLTKQISLSSGVASVGSFDAQHRYAKTSLRGFWKSLFGHVDAAFRQDGGSVASAGIQTRVGPLGLSLERAQLQNFVSEVFPSLFGPTSNRTAVGLNAVLRATRQLVVPITLDFQHEELQSGQAVKLVINRISSAYGNVFLSNRLRWIAGDAPVQMFATEAGGEFLVSKFLRSFYLRGEAIYEFKPVKRMSNVSVSVGTLAIAGYSLQAGIQRSSPSSAMRYLAQVNKTEGAFAFGVNADYVPSHGLTAGLTLSIGLSRDSRTGGWHSQARPVAGAGAASALVFLDNNANGIREAGELPIPNTAFFLNGASMPIMTAGNGVAYFTNLQSYQAAELSVSSASLEDPLWVATRPGVRIVSRPGKVATLDFPVLVTGEVTGTVYIDRGGLTREMSGVPLQLVDGKGTIVSETTSAYDGFYNLTRVPPGQYTIKVDTEKLPALKVTGQLTRHIEILASGTVLDGIDFVLRPEDLGGG